MERRRTDRKEQLANILPLVWYSTQVPITRILSPCAELCANPVRNPGTGTRKILSSHDLYFGLVFLAVNGLQERVLAHLQEAEYREPDAWHRQDYRTAQTVLVLADEGAANPYSKAFRQLFGKNAHEVRFWWRDRAKLFAICEIANSPHPLCHPDIGRRLPDALVPDFDYSQVSSGGAHAERNRAALKGGPLPPAASSASQSGPLERISPLHPTPRAHVHPAKDPASAPIEPTGAGTPRRTA